MWTVTAVYPPRYPATQRTTHSAAINIEVGHLKRLTRVLVFNVRLSLHGLNRRKGEGNLSSIDCVKPLHSKGHAQAYRIISCYVLTLTVGQGSEVGGHITRPEVHDLWLCSWVVSTTNV